MHLLNNVCATKTPYLEHLIQILFCFILLNLMQIIKAPLKQVFSL